MIAGGYHTALALAVGLALGYAAVGTKPAVRLDVPRPTALPAGASGPQPGLDERNRTYCLRVAEAEWRRMRNDAARPLDARDTQALVDGLPPACRRALRER